MRKENVIMLVIVTFVVGFLVGAIGGIKFYTSQSRGGEPYAQTEGGSSQGTVSAADIQRLEDAVKSNPNNLQALIDLGNACFDSNRYQEAIDAYNKALAIDPKNTNVRTDLGTMYRAVKDYDSAIREFREAAKIDPTHKNSRYNLAIVLGQDKKDINGAIAAWEDFLKLSPTGQQADVAKTELQQLKSLAK